MKITPPLTINETQEKLLKKDFSVVDLVDNYLERIKEHDDKINSIITVCGDYAYKQAKKADILLRDYGNKIYENYPLLGAILVHKDIFLTKGVRTTAGSNVLKDYFPSYSGTVVKRLEDAGCIMLGKANCDAWAHGSSGENSDFGATKNPLKKEFVSGGSSSGSAAALASNFCLIATGTDTCGSIRVPANYCGVVGLKPTYGLVSRYGVIAMASSLDCVGHFTRSVEDSEKVFEVITGEDKKDATLQNVKNKNQKSKIKIGIPKEFFVEGLDKEVEKNILEAIGVFKRAGIELVDVSLPHTQYAISVYYIIQPAEVSSNLARYDGVRFGKNRDLFGDEAKRRIMLGTFVLSAGYYDAYYNQAMKVRAIIASEIDRVFDKVDALIAPVAPTPAFKLGEKVDNPLAMYLTDIYSATANLTGIPAMAIPSGVSKNNLPLGFQIMAPKFKEETLFYLGKLFEKSTNYRPRTV